MDEYVVRKVKLILQKLISQTKMLQEQNKELKHKAREIALVHEMSGILNESTGSDKFYQTILDLALRISKSESGCIFIAHPQSMRLQVQAVVGEFELGLLNWLGNRPEEVAQLMLTGEVAAISQREPFLLEMQKRDPLIKSAFFFPLNFDQDRLGLGVVLHRHDEFVKHTVSYAGDTHFLTILAQQTTLVAELNKLKFDQQIQQIYLSTIAALTEAIDAKDVYTAGHSQRVAEISTSIAVELGLSKQEVDTIHYGALLHDIGKIGVPELILNKQGRLTDEEFQAIKKHPVIGTNILRSIAFLEDALHIVRHHHERFDGRGYPDGLKGEGIPVMARIVCVADSWDAMTSNRSYRRALPFNVAIEELEKNAGTQFDPAIIHALQKGSFAFLKTI